MKLLVSALETSANVHLSHLLEMMRDVSITGVFDDCFGTPIVSSKEFGVMGFLDVLTKIPLARRTLRTLVNLAADCDKVLLIDSPAFHIPLAKALKKRYPNKQIIYYILPQVWAWKRHRIEIVEQITDVRAAILPFEQRFWHDAVFVGNPLMDEIAQKKQYATKNDITAFLPGSRRSEIEKLMPIFRESAKQRGGIAILPIPPSFDDEFIADVYGDLSLFEVVRDARYALYEASRAVVCSGTATLEASIIGTPSVLVYKAKPLDYWIAKRFVRSISHVGLANIIADFAQKEEIHPELLQEKVTANNIQMALDELDGDVFIEKSLWLRDVLSHKDVELSQILKR